MKVYLKRGAVLRLLAEKNMSQNWLASRVGTTSGYMSQLMTGKRCPSPDMRESIQGVLRENNFYTIFSTKQITHKKVS